MHLLNSRKCFRDLKRCCIKREKKPMFHIFESFICKAYLGLRDTTIPWDNFAIPDKDPVMAVYVFFLYEYNIHFLYKLIKNKRNFTPKSRLLLTKWYYRVKQFQDKKKHYILGITNKKQRNKTMNVKSVLNKRKIVDLTVENLEEHNRVKKRVKKAIIRFSDEQANENRDRTFKDDDNCSDFDETERVSVMSKSNRSSDSQSEGSLKDFIISDDDEEEGEDSSVGEEKELDENEEDTDAESFDSDQSGWD